MTRNEWNQLMARLAAFFPQREISAETIAAYYEVLGDMDGQVFALAVRECANTCDWFPTVKQLREASLVVLERAGVLPPSPDAAWQLVMQVARGWYEGQTVRDRFDETTWQALRAIGGIRVVALADSGAEVARMERQFRAAYERPYQQATADVQALTLPRRDASPAPALANGRRR